MNTPLKDVRRQIREGNRDFGHKLQQVPPSTWPARRPEDTTKRLAVWRSRDYLVQVCAENDCVRITVNRTELTGDGRWKDGITWDELQRIKRECGFANRTAVEFYPPDEDIVNVSNMRHLFLVEDDKLPTRWRAKRIEQHAQPVTPTKP